MVWRLRIWIGTGSILGCVKSCCLTTQEGRPEGLDWWKQWARKDTRRCCVKLRMIKEQERLGAVLWSKAWLMNIASGKRTW